MPFIGIGIAHDRSAERTGADLLDKLAKLFDEEGAGVQAGGRLACRAVARPHAISAVRAQHVAVAALEELGARAGVLADRAFAGLLGELHQRRGCRG